MKTDAIHGTSTVIAEAGDGKYAFFRGKTHLGNVPTPQVNAPQSQPSSSIQGGESQGKWSGEMLRYNLNQGRSGASEGNKRQLQQLYKNDQKGVQVEKAY